MIRGYSLASAIVNEPERGVCSVEGCARPTYIARCCIFHHRRLKANGDLHEPTREGAISRLVDRALDFADADTRDDAAYRRALASLVSAAEQIQGAKRRPQRKLAKVGGAS